MDIPSSESVSFAASVSDPLSLVPMLSTVASMDTITLTTAMMPTNTVPGVSLPESSFDFEADRMPCFEQRGRLYAGPAASREAPTRGIGLPALTRRSERFVEQAKDFSMQKSIDHVMLKQRLQHQQIQLAALRESIQKQQAITLMCTLYIGSISPEVDEDAMTTAFSAFGPVKSVNMSRDVLSGAHRGYAFLEFENPEGASLAEQYMNGSMVGGRALRVGRPSNMPQGQHIINGILAEAHNHHRLYVASIHKDLCEDDVWTVFEAFGIIISCQLVKGPDGKHRGFGYILYTTAQAVIDACTSMNMFDLGGQLLRVGKAVTPPDLYIPPRAPDRPYAGAPRPVVTTQSVLPSAAALAAAKATAQIQALEACGQAIEPLEKKPNVATSSSSLPGHSNGVQSSSTSSPTTQLGSRLIVLKNMLSPTEIDHSTADEIREECGNYGTIKTFHVHCPKGVDDVFVFVRYKAGNEAQAAINAFTGRFFDGKPISVSVYDEAKFDKGEYQ